MRTNINNKREIILPLIVSYLSRYHIVTTSIVFYTFTEGCGVLSYWKNVKCTLP